MQNLQTTFGDIDLSILKEACRQNDVAFLGVFGSFARGDFKTTSDIDLLVRFSKRKSLLELVRIEREFSSQLGKPVDLVTEDSVSPYIIKNIKRQLKTVYERKG